MTNHKLDEEVLDILQHHGIKGMKWNITRTDEQIASANDVGTGTGGGGEVEEDDESFLEEMGNIVDAMEKKLNSIKKSIKKKGFNILVGIFGKAGDGKARIVKGKSLSKKTISELKKYDKAKPGKRSLMRKGYKSETVTTFIKGSKDL